MKRQFGRKLAITTTATAAILAFSGCGGCGSPWLPRIGEQPADSLTRAAKINIEHIMKTEPKTKIITMPNRDVVNYKGWYNREGPGGVKLFTDKTGTYSPGDTVVKRISYTFSDFRFVDIDITTDYELFARFNIDRGVMGWGPVSVQLFEKECKTVHGLEVTLNKINRENSTVVVSVRLAE
jgi:hypothetical protein